MRPLTLHPLAGRIGARVTGFDLAGLDDASFEHVKDALWRHQVLVFPDQHLDIEDHVAIGRRFGDLHTHPAAAGVDGHPEILLLRNRGKSKNITQVWHSDVSC